MLEINGLITGLAGLVIGALVQEYSFTGRVKKRVDELLLPCWTESRIVAIDRVIESLDQGIRHGRWPTIAHFRRDLIQMSEELKVYHKAGDYKESEE